MPDGVGPKADLQLYCLCQESLRISFQGFFFFFFWSFCLHISSPLHLRWKRFFSLSFLFPALPFSFLSLLPHLWSLAKETWSVSEFCLLWITGHVNWGASIFKGERGMQILTRPVCMALTGSTCVPSLLKTTQEARLLYLIYR